jgi:hypothetical protein
VAKVVIDLNDFDVWLAEWRERFRAGGSGSGRFARIPHGPLDGGACADFAVIDYTTGPWPLPPSETELRAEVLQQYQSQKTGFYDPTIRKATSGFPTPKADSRGDETAEDERMGAVQGTAYFLGALEILGARPMQPLRALEPARTPAGIVELLESLDWANADAESARAAGVATCLATMVDVGPEWFERYIRWLDAEADPQTGFWRKGVPCAPPRALQGAFQQYLVYDRCRAALPYPERALKTALSLQGRDGLYDERGAGWREAGAVYVIDRAFRQCGWNYAHVREALSAIGRATRDCINDTSFREQMAPRRMAGLVSLLALLSSALPGAVRSRRPLRFYADRRLFV